MKTEEKIVLWVVVVVVVVAIVDLVLLKGISIDGFGSNADTDPTSGGTTANVFSSGTGAVDAIFNAIAGGENVASGDNNPVGICAAYDSAGNCTGIVHYGTYAEGAEAGKALITKYLVNNPSITVAQFLQKWTGGYTQGYLSKVLAALHLGANDPIAQAGGGGSAASGGSESDDQDDEDNPDTGDQGDDDDD